MPEQRAVLVTGGASGIGKATADLFAERGWSVVVLDKNAALEQEDVDRTSCPDRHMMFIHADVVDEDSVRLAISRAIQGFGRINASFNSAGILGRQAPLEQLTVQEWSQVWQTNVLGTVLVSKHLIPHYRQHGGGAIVNCASITAITGAPQFPAYSASKGAIMSLTQSMARDLGRSRIRVNCVCPGSILGTSLFTESAGQPLTRPERLALASSIPSGRAGTPQDVAQAVYFLASEEARHLTGAVLRVDGGEMWGR